MNKQKYEIPEVNEIILIPQSCTMQNTSGSTSGGDDPIHWGDGDNCEII